MCDKIEFKRKLICKYFQAGCSNISFDRQAARNDDELPAKMYIFCDSSEEAYGCGMYLLQGRKSSLIFSKSKLAPIPL